MSEVLVIHKNIRNVIPVSMGIDVSTDTFYSSVKSEPGIGKPVIMDFVVSFLTDGTDGELLLTVDDTITGQIQVDKGYMDIRRIVAGEPVPVFDRPVEVEFRDTVTEDP